MAAKISERESLDLSELSHRLGEIQIDDIESTQNALIILVQLVREQVQEITVLKTEIEHLENLIQDQSENPYILLGEELKRAEIMRRA